jgi:ribonuclease-3
MEKAEVLVSSSPFNHPRLLIEVEEGDLILQKHACNKILDAKGQEWSLDKFITTHPAQKGEVSKGVRASTVEAIIGAVWLDSFKNAAEVDRVIDILGLYDD